MSQSEVNTDRVETKCSSMMHTEGGWPKDVDYTEPSDISRFRKKAEKKEAFKAAIKAMCPVVVRCMKQNNTVNIYEDYFVNNGDESANLVSQGFSNRSSDPPSARGLAVFRDPSKIARMVSSIDWHPDGPCNGRIAVSYSIMNFQDPRQNDPNTSLSVSTKTSSIYP